ncbi:hypothetical protein GTQ34_14515 [Muricauda sp. JGD-17]|uniref:Uncharacterized protein n=1 Tax=Flagellimonas ochracea TaxID=2696472 RepID=A0A964TF39_9FLAO|nr:hypothetical protein [Allomuricauda ochracea]NAY93126.1 hypothetical protein [Allomuricauda ochracea]
MLQIRLLLAFISTCSISIVFSVTHNIMKMDFQNDYGISQPNILYFILGHVVYSIVLLILYRMYQVHYPTLIDALKFALLPVIIALLPKYGISTLDHNVKLVEFIQDIGMNLLASVLIILMIRHVLFSD